jgi:hypothetical protein
MNHPSHSRGYDHSGKYLARNISHEARRNEVFSSICYFSFRSRYLFRQPVLEHRQPIFFTYKTTGKIIFLMTVEVRYNSKLEWGLHVMCCIF